MDHVLIVTSGPDGPEVRISPDAYRLLQQTGLEIVFLPPDDPYLEIITDDTWYTLRRTEEPGG